MVTTSPSVRSSSDWRPLAHRAGVMGDTFPVLATERLVLREITLADAASLYGIFSDRDLMRFYDCEPLTSIGEMQDLIQRFASWLEERSGLRWGLALKSDPDTLIGTCGLFAWDTRDHSATLGYELSPDYWGRGLMSEAVRAVVAYGYGGLGLERICAAVVVGNDASARLLERLFFRKEGVTARAQHVNGSLVDVADYALLRTEWMA
jgi:[ribosomal protein S5]-alanine N-acetyltransferase